jgi:hypothetical protein
MITQILELDKIELLKSLFINEGLPVNSEYYVIGEIIKKLLSNYGIEPKSVIFGPNSIVINVYEKQLVDSVFNKQ